MRPICLLSWIALLISFNTHAGTLDSPRKQTELVSFQNLSKEKYLKLLKQYKKKDYRPIDVEIKVESRERTYALIMRKNTDNKKWQIRTQLTSDEFSKEWKKLKKEGYRLIDQESYQMGYWRKKQYYAGIWIKKERGLSWASNRNLTSEKFSKRLRNYTDAGFFPIDVDAYKMDDKTYWSGVWVENTESLAWSLRRNIKEEDFGDHYEKYDDRGYRLLDTNSYMIGDNQYFATIWVKDKRRRNLRAAGRRDMSSRSFHNWNNRFTDMGYRLEDTEQYKTPQGDRYAGVWVENNRDKMYWSKKSEVASKISDWRENNSHTSISVAIAHKGKLRYTRGFGQHNKEENRDAHSGTIYRTASIAKAYTGVLGFILQDEGKINLNDNIQSYLPELPEDHDYLLGSLLSNSSGVRGYQDNQREPVGLREDKYFNEAWPAVEYFMNDRVVDYFPFIYSTHGYTIFAAAVEKETGKKYCNLLDDKIAGPYELSTLHCENQKAVNFDDPERAQIYKKNGGSKINRAEDDLSWKYAGGGLETSVADLARFGMYVDQNKILSKRDVQTMTTRRGQIWAYGYGWVVSMNDGNKEWYAKGGSQDGARTYLRVYPDEDLITAIMINHKTDDDLRDLTDDIAEEVIE